MKLTLEVFLGYSYDLAFFHPGILIEAILIKNACILFIHAPRLPQNLWIQRRRKLLKSLDLANYVTDN